MQGSHKLGFGATIAGRPNLTGTMVSYKSKESEKNEQRRMQNQIASFIAIAGVCFFAAYMYLTNGPSLSAYSECTETQDMTIVDLPKAIVSDGLKKFGYDLFPGTSTVEGTAKNLMKCGRAYQVDHPNYVTGAFVTVYVLLQTFAIPGPIILSVLAGVFYDSVYIGVGIVATCCAVGSSLCYMLSYFTGKIAIQKMVPEKIAGFRERIESNRGNLLWYMLFLRLTPILPNWFINVASPIVNVPLPHFAAATFFGTTPANVVYFYAGKVLKDSGKFDSSKGYKTALTMAILAGLSLLPTLLKSKLTQMEKGMGGRKTGKNRTTAPSGTPLRKSARQAAARAKSKDRD